MIRLLLVLLYLCPAAVAAGADGPCIPSAQDTVASLVEAFEGLPEGAEKERCAILGKVGVFSGGDVDVFLAGVMEKDGNREVRLQAFIIWAGKRDKAEVRAFLDRMRRTAGFRHYLPALPSLTGFDSIAYLKGVYNDVSLERLRGLAVGLIAETGDDKAFRFLEKTWKAARTPSEAFELMPAILSMEKSRTPGFTAGLLESRHPFARLAGAKRLLTREMGADFVRLGDFLAAEANPRVRQELLSAAAELGTPGAARLVIDAARSQESERLHEIVTILAGMKPGIVRAAVPDGFFLDGVPVLFQVSVLSLSFFDDPSALFGREGIRVLKKGMGSHSPAIRLSAAVAFARATGKENSAKIKIGPLFGSKAVETTEAALDIVRHFRLKDRLVVRKVLSLFSSKNWELRIQAARTAGALGEAGARPHLEKCLTSLRFLVRIAAIKALGRLGGKESIPPLLARLPKETGRTAWEIARSLKAITGRDFGVGAAQWNKWWSSVSDAPLEPVPPNPAWPGTARKESRYGFYGLNYDSHNIVFVLDISRSMSGGRITKLRREMESTLKRLTAGYRINMIFFQTSVSQWKDGLVPMDDDKTDHRGEAIARVKYLKADGATNLYGALKAAYSDEEVDTIVLFTDGDPTAGKITDKNDLIVEVRKWNRTGQVTIQVVAVGSADRTFMQRLATVTGGAFIAP
jgi:Mg-chelatase subunit ChlD